MRWFFSLCLLGASGPIFADQSFFAKKPFGPLAQNSLNSAFDPFIDYGEFQENVTEEENINFFQSGRALSVALAGGFEALTLNIRQIYGDAAFVGAGIQLFVDLRFAFQARAVFPTGHYNSLLNSSYQFSHYGLDLKYYFNRQYITKDASFFNPYIIFGPFWLNIKSALPPHLETQQPAIPVVEGATQPAGETEEAEPTRNPPVVPTSLSAQEKRSLQSFNAAGIKAGIGIEIPFIKQSFFGAELSYLYTVLQHEAEDLSLLDLPPPNYKPNQNIIEWIFYPNRPQLRGYRFFGDLVNISFLFGVNF